MSTITVDLNELRTLLSRVIPFAQQSNFGLPVIESVYLTGKGGYLIATATDRYVVGMARQKVEGADGFEALVKIKDVKHILATFKSRKDVFAKVTLATDGESGTASLTVALADGLFADADDLTARYSLIDGKFPGVAAIFREWKAPAEVTGTGYNPAYLAKFAHVTESRGEPIKVTGGGLKPTIVQAGDYFLGAIMPVRLVDVAITELSEWVTTLGEPAAEQAAPVKKATAKKAPARKRTATKAA